MFTYILAWVVIAFVCIGALTLIIANLRERTLFVMIATGITLAGILAYAFVWALCRVVSGV